MSNILFISLVLSISLYNCVDGYKPVIIVHGLFDAARSMSELVEFINQVKTAVRKIQSQVKICRIFRSLQEVIISDFHS